MTATLSVPNFGEEYAARLHGFLDLVADRRITVGTLGPVGTSSHDAAAYLQETLMKNDGGGPVVLRLYDQFEPLLSDVCEGRVDLALVPSAYRDATAFHWHPRLELAFHFARRTPSYGLASGAGGPPVGPLSLAAMPETRSLCDTLCPPELRGRVMCCIDAKSTHHAAQMVADGQAHLALTNEKNRELFGLRWLASRRGTEVVWLLFQNTEQFDLDALTAPSLHDDGELR